MLYLLYSLTQYLQSWLYLLYGHQTSLPGSISFQVTLTMVFGRINFSFCPSSPGRDSRFLPLLISGCVCWQGEWLGWGAMGRRSCSSFLPVCLVSSMLNFEYFLVNPDSCIDHKGGTQSSIAADFLKRYQKVLVNIEFWKSMNLKYV